MVPNDIIVEVLERLRVLHLQPDDTLVILSPEHLSMATVDRLKDQLLKVFPGQRCMVLDGGAQVGILRTTDRSEGAE